MAKKHIPNHLQEWIEARNRFHLSHAQVQMARELGLNPRKLGKIANDDQEPWKLPLPEFIENIYEKRFHREQPVAVGSIEEKFERDRQRKEAKKKAKIAAREGSAGKDEIPI